MLYIIHFTGLHQKRLECRANGRWARGQTFSGKGDGAWLVNEPCSSDEPTCGGDLWVYYCTLHSTTDCTGALEPVYIAATVSSRPALAVAAAHHCFVFP